MLKVCLYTCLCVQEDWSLDVSEAAMKERQRDLTAGVKNLTISNDIEKTQSERLEVFFEYCKVSVCYSCLLWSVCTSVTYP